MGYSKVHRFIGKEGYERVITPENSGCEFLGFSRILIGAGKKLEFEVKGEELGIVLQQGDFKASVYWKGKLVYDGITGKRSNVFDELPTAIYLPPNSKIVLESKTGMEARVFSIACDEGNEPFFCEPKDVEEGTPGAFNWRRKYRFIFGPPTRNNSNVTRKLIVGESVSMPGGWVGFPGHKHDFNNSEEYPLDEIFSIRVKSPRGMGTGTVIQYSFDNTNERWDEFNVIEDDQTAISLPEGYHTSMAVPGCTEYLLWGLGGQEKIYKIKFDERYDWIFEAEALQTF